MIQGNKLMIVGVGHRFRGDDLVGPYVCDLLKERLEKDGQPSWGRIDVIDADVMPENFSKPIRNSDADIVLFIDAVDLEREPGAIFRLGSDAIGVPMPNTHSMPLTFIMQRLLEHKERVELIGVQAMDLGLFNEMTDPIRKSGETLADMIYEGTWEVIPTLER